MSEAPKAPEERSKTDPPSDWDEVTQVDITRPTHAETPVAKGCSSRCAPLPRSCRHLG